MDNQLNKAELIESVAEEFDVSKAEATRILSLVFDKITSALVEGTKVSLAGFGTFESKLRAARTGRNPQTGEAIEIKASNTVGFKAAKALKDAVNESCNVAEEV